MIKNRAHPETYLGGEESGFGLDHDDCAKRKHIGSCFRREHDSSSKELHSEGVERDGVSGCIGSGEPRPMSSPVSNAASPEAVSRPAESKVDAVTGSSRYRVSAIVSLYKAEIFLRGRLMDLVEQSLFKKGELQIVIVNSGSPENEGRIVREFKNRFDHIRYLETSKRESLYQAWNRCIEYSDGLYLTNANADDRLRQDAYEKLAKALDDNPSAGFSYGDAMRSDKANERFSEIADREVYSSQNYFAPDLLLHQFFGHQAMWRRSLHGRVGLFEPRFKAAGDYDFFLRGALVSGGVRVADCLGALLRRSDSITFADGAMNREVAMVRKQFRTRETILRLFLREGMEIESEGAEEACLIELGNRALAYYPQWRGGRPDADFEFAKFCYGLAMDGGARGPKSELGERIARRNANAVGILSGETDPDHGACDDDSPWDPGRRQVSIAWPSSSFPLTADGIANAVDPFGDWVASEPSETGWRYRKANLERYWMALLSLEEADIHCLKDYCSNGGALAIWGASSRGCLLKRVLYRKRIQAMFFIDNDRSKIGSKVNGLAVRGSDDLAQFGGRLKVLLACSEQQERFIRSQLESEGLESLLWDGR